jgi:hypothetical protein
MGQHLTGRRRRLGALRMSLIDRQHGIQRNARADRHHQGAATERRIGDEVFSNFVISNIVMALPAEGIGQEMNSLRGSIASGGAALLSA